MTKEERDELEYISEKRENQKLELDNQEEDPLDENRIEEKEFEDIHTRPTKEKNQEEEVEKSKKEQDENEDEEEDNKSKNIKEKGDANISIEEEMNPKEKKLEKFNADIYETTVIPITKFVDLTLAEPEYELFNNIKINNEELEPEKIAYIFAKDSGCKQNYIFNLKELK